ncbi:phage tail tape measure protein, partial [Halomonas citrativorans]|uniref:phage tail tape measure protein n=1 Tax=Halomonas citrativorans TaxID=2742612 RepID=UPI000B363008
MANNLTLSVTLTGDGRQLSGTLKDAQGDVREFSATTERESKKAESALQRPGREAGTVSEHLRGAQQEARTFGSETDQGSRQATQALAQTGKETQTVSNHLSKMRSLAVGAAMALVSMASGFGLSGVISQTAAFEDSILGLQATSGATVQQISQLEGQARSLGATSMHSAKQSADAQRFLAQAGFDVNEVLAATPSVLSLATAGQMDLAQAADIASNVLGGMRMEVDQLNRVNDVMAATSARSNTNIMQLGDAFSYAGPFAASAGISIETTSAAIGVLSDAGLQASRAGTGLIGIIRQLSNVTPQAAGVLANYGLTIEDVNIEAHGLETVLERIRDANMTTADAFAIFGSEAGAAAQILAASAGRVREFGTELNSVEGEVDRMALIIGSGLTGSIRGFNSMLSESVLQLGESGVSGAFGLVVDNATGVLAVYNDMLPALAEANDLTDEQVARIEALAGGIDLLGDALIITGGIMAGRYVGAIAASQVALTAKATVAAAATGTLNLLTGATTRQAAAATAMAGATRAATGALMLMGGPLGLLVG